MKEGIHPTYNDKITVTCSCGNSFTTGSTAKAMTVEVCSACHPFYTGKQKLVDVAGRVDKFRQRQQEAKSRQDEKKKKKDTDKKSAQRSDKEQVTKLR